MKDPPEGFELQFLSNTCTFIFLPPTPLPTSVFFFNSETGESRWDKPDEVMEAEAQRMAEEPTPSVARRRRSIGVVSHLDQESGAVWMKYTDPVTNAVVSHQYS